STRPRTRRSRLLSRSGGVRPKRMALHLTRPARHRQTRRQVQIGQCYRADRCPRSNNCVLIGPVGPSLPWLFMGGVGSGREASRVSEVAEAAADLRAELGGWFDKRGGDERLRRFARHFEVLRAVLEAMVDAVTVEVAKVSGDTGAIYARCRHLDGCLVLA